MVKTRLSLFYLLGYLSLGGLALLAAPQPAMKLLAATGEYDDLMVRMIGSFLLALGLIVVQIIRKSVEVLYGTTLVVRSFLLTALAVFFVAYRDPFLLVLMVIVGFGFAITLGSFWIERRRS